MTGARGQVGAAVVERLGEKFDVIAHDRSTLDLADPAQLAARVRAARPDAIVNAAAYTAVDRAESEAAAAAQVNGVAPAVLAAEAKALGAILVHYSTDYVFDGTRAGAYVEDDPTNPLGTYGATKLAGERAIAASGCAHVILRTSWVYGPRGRNFLLTMLNAAKTRDELRVVDDQHGAPTSSLQLARATEQLLAQGAQKLRESSGVYHASAAGETSWHGFATAIFARWSAIAPSPFKAPRIVAIPTRDYPTPVRRPANSRLSNARLAATFGITLEAWETALDEVLAELRGPFPSS